MKITGRWHLDDDANVVVEKSPDQVMKFGCHGACLEDDARCPVPG